MAIVLEALMVVGCRDGGAAEQQTMSSGSPRMLPTVPLLEWCGWDEYLPGEAREVGSPGWQISGVLFRCHSMDSDTDVVGETTEPKMGDKMVEIRVSGSALAKDVLCCCVVNIEVYLMA